MTDQTDSAPSAGPVPADAAADAPQEPTSVHHPSGGSRDGAESGGAEASSGPAPAGAGSQDGDAGGRDGGPARLKDLVDEPAKVMRIGTMIKQLLDEVRNAPLDDAARNRLAEIHERSLKELEDGLAPELVSELHRITLPFLDDTVPTDAELRIAQAQLVGWLEGLFRGIQTAIAAQQTANQQLASRLQLRQLPPGTVLAPGVIVGEDGEPRRANGPAQQPRAARGAEPQAGPGQYL